MNITDQAIPIEHRTNRALREFYLDYVNNYLTVEKIAEHNELTVHEAHIMINAGRRLHEQQVVSIQAAARRQA